MARLASITEEQFNDIVYSTPVSKLIRPEMVVKVFDNTNSKGDITYKKANSNKKQRRITTENRAALLAEFNTINVTSGPGALSVGVLKEDDTVYASAKAMDIDVNQVIEIRSDINNAANSRIEYQKFSGKTKIFIVSQDLTNLKGQANA